MTKRRREITDAYTRLRKDGLDLSKGNQICPNNGSETVKHLVGKTLVAKIGLANNYRVASEVTYPDDKECDVLLWGNPERQTYAIELETGWTEEKKSKKRGHYVKGYPSVDDMLTVEVLDMPTDMLDALGYIQDEIGLYHQ